MEILVSPGYGAGLDEFSFELRTDIKLIDLIKNKELDKAEKYIELLDENLYTGGLRDAEVGDIPKGKKFRIDEYDGGESVSYEEDESGWVAK